MFDGLMGSKFVAKCKQVIKTTLERVARSRSKKAAMLKFVNKDIAELLQLGYEDKAIARLDGVVTDSNLIRCYDLIADFCDTVVANFPLLHKHKSECPPECVEAVATLIFAAARFADLPELCRLRTLFLERYGDAMESSVNPEFVEKVSKRTVSTNEKLKLMQEIANEHNVKWNSNNYGHKKAPASQSVQPKQDVPSTDHLKGQKPVDVMRSASAKMVEDQNGLPRQRVVDPYQRGVSLPKEHQMRQPVARDIHIAEHDRAYYHHEAKVVRAEVKNVQSSDTHQNVRKEYRMEVHDAAEVVSDSKKSNAEEAVKVKPVNGFRMSTVAPSPYVKQKGVDGVASWDQVPAAPVRGVDSVATDNKVPVELARGYGRNEVSGGTAFEEVERVKHANGYRASNVAPPPYVKQRDASGATSWDQVPAKPVQGMDSVMAEKKAPGGLARADGGNKSSGGTVLEEVETDKHATGYRASNMAPPPYVKQRHMHGASLDKAVGTQPDLGLRYFATHDERKNPAVMAKEDESNRALKEVHVYVKPSVSNIDDHRSNKVTSEEATVRSTPKKEHPNRAESPKPCPASFWPPPYVKPSHNRNASNPEDYPKFANNNALESGSRAHARSPSEIENLPVLDEHLSRADRLQKPRSVRRIHRKPYPIVEDYTAQVEHVPERWHGHNSFQDLVIEDDASRIPRRRNPQVEPKQGGGLYPHQDGRAEPQLEPKQRGGLYSNQDGRAAEPQKERGGRFHSHQDGEVANAVDNATTTPHERKQKSDRRRHHHAPEDVGPANAVHDADHMPSGSYHPNDRQGQHNSEKEVNGDDEIDFLLMHYSKKGTPDNTRQIKRVLSLPHEDSPKAVRVPTRAVSSLSKDEPSPNGRHQIPDYDELAARFNALKMKLARES